MAFESDRTAEMLMEENGSDFVTYCWGGGLTHVNMWNSRKVAEVNGLKAAMLF